jgi:hypothetical protein
LTKRTDADPLARLARVKADLGLLKWMVGVNTALMGTVLLILLLKDMLA